MCLFVSTTPVAISFIIVVVVITITVIIITTTIATAFEDRVSCGPGHPQIFFCVEDDLELLTFSLLPLSPVLRLQA